MSTVTIRLDPETDRALAALVAERGTTKTEAVKNAILESARTHRRARVNAEAERLRSDPADVAAARALEAEMDSTSAW